VNTHVLTFVFRNTGDDAGKVHSFVGGQREIQPAPGVPLGAGTVSPLTIPAGGENSECPEVRVEADAQPGTLPEIRLEVTK